MKLLLLKEPLAPLTIVRLGVPEPIAFTLIFVAPVTLAPLCPGALHSDK